MPDIVGFMNYSLYNQIWKYENMGMSKQSKRLAEFAIKIIELVEKPMDKALRNRSVLMVFIPFMIWQQTQVKFYQLEIIRVKVGFNS